MVVEEDNRFYEQLKGGGGRRRIIDGGGDGKRTIKPQLKPPLFAQIEPPSSLLGAPGLLSGRASTEQELMEAHKWS